MTNAMRFAAPAIFMIIVLTSGLIHADRTFRWVPKPPLDQYLDRIDRIPKEFENWTSEDSTFSDDLRTHGIEKYLFRTYFNRRTTEKYRVLVVCGRPGPIAAHTPDVCYRGSGYTAIGDPKPMGFTVASDNNPAKGQTFPMYYLKFRPPVTQATEYELEIRWAWLPPNGGLKAPNLPRIEFSNEPALYKVYILHERPAVAVSQQPSMAGTSSPLPQPVSQIVHDPKLFLESFLPRLEEALKPSAAP